MDAKDFRLLVALHEDARASYRALGRRVGLTAPAVRDRLRRMEAKGVFHGFWITPDPQCLGREDLLVLFSADRTREDLEAALRVPDVAWAAWKTDGGLTVQVWPHDAETAVRQLSAALGVPPAGRTIAEPTPHEPLSDLDWRIMDALVDDPRMPFGEICERTGLSTKTVRKRLLRMRRGGAVYITPKLGHLGDAGEIVFPLLVSGSVRAPEVRQAMGDALLINDTEVPPMKYFLCRATDMGQVTARLKRVQGIPGVESAVVTVNRELVVNTPFIHAVIREQRTTA